MQQDKFDRVRSTMFLIKSPVGCGTYWYKEWMNVDILPIGKTPLGGHMYSIEGWKQINGEPHLIIEAWIGRKLYMPRAVFNEAMKPVGMQSWVLSTAEVENKKIKNLLETLRDLLLNLYIALRGTLTIELSTKPAVSPVEPVLPQPEAMQPKYLWDTPVLARHSVRVICDEYFLTWIEKDVICAVIQGESNFNPKAVNKNTNGTVDYGICQINDYWHIGEGKAFASPEEVLNNPEKSVRFMVEMFKEGKIKLWNAFKNGSYKRYLNG